MRIITAAALLAALPLPVLAASPIANVGSAKVDEGKLNIEARAGYTLDNVSNSANQRLQTRQHIDYGFTDWYAFRLITAQDNRKGDSFEHSSITLENRIQLIEKKDYGWDGGVRLQYVHRDGDKTPHEIDFRLMAMTDISDKWAFRHNTVLERDVGENQTPGVALELRNQLAYKLDSTAPYIKKLEIGAEMINDFGKLNQQSGFSAQDHQIGPVLKASFANGAYVQTGYRMGVTHGATDHSFKLFVGRNF